MVSLRSLSVRSRLTALIVLPMFGMVVFGVFAKHSLDQVRVGGPLFAEIVVNKDLIADTVPPPASVLEAFALCAEVPGAKTPAEREELLKDLERVAKDYENSKARWTRDLPEGAIRKAMTDGVVKVGDEFFESVRTQYIPLVRAEKSDEAAAFLSEKLAPAFRDQQAKIAEVVTLANEQSKALEARSGERIASAQWMLIAMGLGLVAATVVMGWWIAGGIAKPVAKIRDFMAELAQGGGNLQQRVNVGDDRSEIGQLAYSFNSFLRLINALLLEVRTVSDEVCTSSHRIASASEQTNRSMTVQTESMRDIMGFMDQIAESTSSVAERTAQAMLAAKSTGEVAVRGADVVQKTIEKMRSIDAGVTSGSESVTKLGSRSQEIGQIIGVINDIADQTNLLALNAAIEAARAGEHGRGFAVVADEVRKLADRTTKATKQVAESIQQIQQETKVAVDRMGEGTKEVRMGVELAGTASQGLQQIVEQAGQTSKLTSEIEAASRAQAEQGAQMRRHIEGFSATSAEVFTLSEKTRTLSEAVKRFKIDPRQEDRRTVLAGVRSRRGKIVDVTADGVCIDLDEPVRGGAGDSFSIELEIGGVVRTVPSTIVWARGQRVGLKFAQVVPELEARGEVLAAA
jgi:methyl-accepting chemotaxis protein